MNRGMSSYLLAALLLSCVAAAPAAEQQGFYVGGSLGRGEMDIDPSRVAFGASFGPVSGITLVRPSSTSVDDGQLTWSGVLGYRIGEHFAAELAYTDFGNVEYVERYVIPPQPGIPGNEFLLEHSTSVKGPSLSVLGSLPVGTAWDLFLRAGVLFADRRDELQGLVVNGNTSSFGSEVWLAGAGVDWSFKPRWSLRAEYQRSGKLDANFMVGESYVEQLSLSVLFRL